MNEHLITRSEDPTGRRDRRLLQRVPREVAEYVEPWAAYRQLRPERRWLKRAFDLVVVTVAIPFLAPVGLLCALAIKLEDPDASVFFTQTRTGRHGRRFPMFKFRSMVPDADKKRGGLQQMSECTWPDFKITKDPRVTRVGRVLRSVFLDELPQIFNVLRGEMSLVGPRPTSWPMEQYEEWQKARLATDPGLTGMWQIISKSTGGLRRFGDRVRMDILYMRHRTLWLDLRILLATGVLMLIKRLGDESEAGSSSGGQWDGESGVERRRASGTTTTIDEVDQITPLQKFAGVGTLLRLEARTASEQWPAGLVQRQFERAEFACGNYMEHALPDARP